MSTSHENFTEMCKEKLDRLSREIESNLDAMLALLSGGVNKPSRKLKSNQCKLDLLEVYCRENSNLTNMAVQMGVKAKLFAWKDGDLATTEGQEHSGDFFLKNALAMCGLHQSANCGGSFSRLNMCRSLAARERILKGRKAEQTHFKLCDEVYEYQVV